MAAQRLSANYDLPLFSGSNGNKIRLTTLRNRVVGYGLYNIIS